MCLIFCQPHFDSLLVTLKVIPENTVAKVSPNQRIIIIINKNRPANTVNMIHMQNTDKYSKCSHIYQDPPLYYFIARSFSPLVAI